MKLKPANLLLLLALPALLLCACGLDTDPYGTPLPESGVSVSEGSKPFVVTSGAVVDGVLDDAYGYRAGPTEVNRTSLPLLFQDPPEGTVCYALVFTDPDSVREAGYEQVLWLAANIKAGELPPDASATMGGEMVQGMNHEGYVGYVGPAARTQPHTCLLTAYALDSELALSNTFSLADLDKAMEGHILDVSEMTASYNNEGPNGWG